MDNIGSLMQVYYKLLNRSINLVTIHVVSSYQETIFDMS